MPANRIRVNFSDVEDFEVLPAGVYQVQVEDVEEKQSQSSEYTYLNWTMIITEGESKNRKLWSMTSLSPKAAFKMREALVAFGEDPASLKADFDFDPNDYIGRHLLVTVIQETYNGRLQNKIESMNPPPNGGGRREPAAAGSGGNRRVIR